MRILVTGGAAFNGSVLIRHIICYTNDSVVNLDKLTYTGNLESLAAVNDSGRYAFEQLNACDDIEGEWGGREQQPEGAMYLAVGATSIATSMVRLRSSRTTSSYVYE
jgi:dTDP-glucose 4,6-dehydratase